MKKLLTLLLISSFVFCQTANPVTWTKDWTVLDDDTILGGQNIGDIQDDIDFQAPTLTGANAWSGRNAFQGTTTISGLSLGVVKHYRKGLTLKAGTAADEDIVVCPGTIDIDETNLTATADSSDLDVGSETFLAGTTGTSQWIYVYVFNNSDAIGYKLSTEAPDLSDADDKVVETPFRYQKYGTVYYRCIGAVFQDAAGDLCFGQGSSEGLYVTNFDASNRMIIGGIGNGSDQTFNTIWTPKYVNTIHGQVDATPTTGEDLTIYEATQLMLDTNWYGTQLNVQASPVVGAEHRWVDIATQATTSAITAQAAGTSGSYTMQALTDSDYFYTIVWTDEGF